MHTVTVETNKKSHMTHRTVSLNRVNRSLRYIY